MQKQRQIRQRSRIFLIVIVLILLAVVSTALLGSRFGLFRSSVPQTDIELSEMLADTSDNLSAGAEDEDRTENGAEEIAEPFSNKDEKASEEAQGGLSASADAKPELLISDDEQVWHTDTQVEIFKVSYSNENGEVTVISENGDKVFAPGTSNSYRFRISNTGNAAMDYTLVVDAFLGEESAAIPIEVKLSDQNGNFLAGDADTWTSVMNLKGVADSASLAENHYAVYTLDWQWPFEGDDDYDTFLGNLTQDTDVTLTIVLRTSASESTDPLAAGGIPQTGDTMNLMLWSAFAVASFMILLLLLAKPRNEEEEKSDKNDNA